MKSHRPPDVAMSKTYWGREHDLLNAKLLKVLEHCKLEKKLAKKVTLHKVPLKIKDYVFVLVFSQPAKFVHLDRKKLQIDIKMKTALYSVDDHYPENEGTSTVRYKISYEGVGKTLQFRSATIVELSFAEELFDLLKKGMKKKAGKLNLSLSVEKCF